MAGPTQTTLAVLMTRRVVTVSMDDSLRTIRELFETHQFHHLLVVESRRLVGIISDRDLLKHVSPFVGRDFSERSQDLATLNKRAHQIMSHKPVTAKEQTTVTEAINLLLNHRVSCLPIVDDSFRAVGIVTWRDLLRPLAGPVAENAAA